MQQKYLELKVGIFVLIGLISVGLLIVSFGRFAELFHPSYALTVQFDNTSGVIKNSQVLYRGARVGTVTTAPQIAERGKYVWIGLKINNDVLIDKGSSFEVGSYGLLGDRFIDVLPPVKETGEFFQKGDIVVGTESVELSDLAAKVGPIIARVSEIITSMEEEGIVENLSSSVESVKGITEKLDNILAAAEETQGPIYTLLSDAQTAGDIKGMVRELKILSENLRKKGILFYKDVSEDNKKNSSKESKANARVKRTRSR